MCLWAATSEKPQCSQIASAMISGGWAIPVRVATFARGLLIFKAKKACFEQLAECKMISKCQNAHLPGSLNFSIQSLQQIAVDVKSPDCTIFFVSWLHSLYLHRCTCSSAKMAPQNLKSGCGKPIGCEVGIIHMCGELRHVRNKKSNFNTSSLCTAFLQTVSAQKKTLDIDTVCKIQLFSFWLDTFMQRHSESAFFQMDWTWIHNKCGTHA